MEDYGAYLVIKILSPNRNDLLNEYVCVPKSWVKVKDRYDNYVVFGYPLEDRIDTRLRVKEYQPLGKKWPMLYGEVVFNTDSQEEAFRLLESKMHELESDSDQSKDTREQDDNKEIETTTSHRIRIKPIKLSSKKPNCRSKRKQPEQENILHNNKFGKKSENGIESILLESNELIRTYASDVDNEETVSSSTSNNLHNIKLPDTTQILPNETDNGKENTPVNKENAQKITGRPRRQSTRLIRNLSQGYLELSEEEFEGFEYQTTSSIVDNAADYLHTIISAHKDNIASEAVQSQLATNQQPDAINTNTFSHPQPLLQERPSCSDEDTKWTVRYPEPGPGIIELLPHSGVYVSKKGLNECKSTYSETTKFTRGLLEEVFTEEALKTCSFSGISRKRVTNVKPALDLKAREIFVDYVLQYSREMGWKKANSDIIMNCIRNRLQSLCRLG